MDDQKFQENLYRYLDGELTSVERAEFEALLQKDPLLKLAFDREKGFDQLLRQHVRREEAPYELREAVVAQLNKPSIWEMPRALGWKKLVALSTVVCFLIVFGVQLNQPFPVFAESIKTHTDYLKGAYPLEIRTTDVNEALRWFEGKVDFAVERPHLNLKQVNLVGARIAHIKDKKVAYFIYEKDGHTISAFFTDLGDKNLPHLAKEFVMDHPKNTVYLQQDKGYSSIVCFHKTIKTACILVSDLPQDELMRLMG